MNVQPLNRTVTDDEVLVALDRAIQQIGEQWGYTYTHAGWATSSDVAEQLGNGMPTRGELCQTGSYLAQLRKAGLAEHDHGSNSPRYWTITSAGDDRLYELAHGGPA